MKKGTLMAAGLAAAVLLSSPVLAAEEQSREPVALRQDHSAYMQGMGQDKFGPQEHLTWAQVCTIIFNLMEDQSMGQEPSSFTDVAQDQWFYQAITTLASRGILQCDGGELHPDSEITRGEFAVLVVGLVGVDDSASSSFTDVAADASQYPYISTATSHGWLRGFEDGSFRPEECLTRAQATAVFNRILGRSLDPALDADQRDLSRFVDVTGEWYYGDVMEATVSHDATVQDGEEHWSNYSHTYTLTFQDGDQTSKVLVPEGKQLSQIPSTGGVHWLTGNGSVASLGGTVTASGTYRALYAPSLKTAHDQYVKGYPDGSFQPNGQVTRAEAAQMLYGMLADQSRGSFPCGYDDVGEGMWFYDAVTTLASRGLLTSGGSFRPNDPMTRGEYVEMLTRLTAYVSGGSFTDVSAEDPNYAAVSTAAGKGWVQGYEDGSFRPDGHLTRAESVTVMNRILGRVGDSAAEQEMDERYTFTDAAKGEWYYQAVMEAAVSHSFTSGGSGESWSSYSRAYNGSVSWEDSASVVAAASITQSVGCVYNGDFTHSYNWDYSTAKKEQFVNGQGYSSKTSWLAWVNLQNQKVYLFTGKQGNWKLEKTFICGSGSPKTPTPTGVTYVTYRQSLWDFGKYICRPVVRFYPNTGYAFHSRLFKRDGTSFYDNSIGWPVSEGCIRMLDPDIQYIYDNVPNNTTVVIY